MARVPRQTVDAIAAARRAGLDRKQFAARVEKLRGGCWGLSSIFGRGGALTAAQFDALRREGFSVRAIYDGERLMLAYAVYDGKGRNLSAEIEQAEAAVQTARGMMA